MAADDGGVGESTQTMLDSTTALIWAIDRDYRLLSDNEAFRTAQRRHTGRHAVIGTSVFTGAVDVQREAAWRSFYDRALTGERHTVHLHQQFGAEATFEYTFSPILDANGNVIGVTVEGLDVTTEVTAVHALEESEGRFRSIFEHAGDVAFVTDANFILTFVTDSLREVFGYSPDEAIGQSMWYVFDVNAFDPPPKELAARLAQRGARVVAKARLTDSSGARRTIETVIVNLLDDAAVRGYAGTVRDTTDELRSADLLEYRRSLLRLAGRLAKVGGWAVDAASRRVTLSEELYGLLDIDPATFETTPLLEDSLRLYVREWRDPLRRAFEACISEGTPFDMEVEAKTALGRQVWLQVIGEAQRSSSGAIVAVQGAIADVSERHHHEAVLGQQATLLDKATDAIIERDLNGKVVYWNRAAETLYGWSKEEAIGAWLPDLIYLGVPDSFNEINDIVQRQGEWFGRRMHYRRDGKPLWIEIHINLLHDEYGHPSAVFSIGSDVTERVELEERLALAQRLESIGQLTGGIAHDFNNLLTVIIGGAELLATDLADNPKLGPMASMILSAAERGGQLTSRLLSFARRQSLQPTVVDPCTIVKDMLELLRRTLSETVDVVVEHEQDVWTVAVDHGLLEAAIVNVSVNARDAMPQGGTLRIGVSNDFLDADRLAGHPDAEPGDYVRIRIADDGDGMEPHVLARAFDPFFTTKDVGKGSGLGLSMVYGFIKQSGGVVEIDSAPGVGTTIDMYLPRAAEDLPDAAIASSAMTPGGHETVLVVEDNNLVRAHACHLLRDLGYRVLEAPDGPTAIVVLSSDVLIDVLFTDIVMPNGMNGVELAAAARTLRPGLPVLYTSGYSEHGTVVTGMIADGRRLLTKPYHREDLARMIRLVLDRGDRTGGIEIPSQLLREPDA